MIHFARSFSVEHAVFKMTKTEHCKLYLKSKATKGVEKFNIPADSPVEYEVILHKFERVRKFPTIVTEQPSVSIVDQRRTKNDR